MGLLIESKTAFPGSPGRKLRALGTYALGLLAVGGLLEAGWRIELEIPSAIFDGVDGFQTAIDAQAVLVNGYQRGYGDPESIGWFRIDAAGAVRVTKPGYKHAALSPDGELCAFSISLKTSKSRQSRLQINNATGKKIMESNGYDYIQEHPPCWSPDSAYCAFIGKRRTTHCASLLPVGRNLPEAMWNPPDDGEAKTFLLHLIGWMDGTLILMEERIKDRKSAGLRFWAISRAGQGRLIAEVPMCNAQAPGALSLRRRSILIVARPAEAPGNERRLYEISVDAGDVYERGPNAATHPIRTDRTGDLLLWIEDIGDDPTPRNSARSRTLRYEGNQVIEVKPDRPAASESYDFREPASPGSVIRVQRLEDGTQWTVKTPRLMSASFSPSGRAIAAHCKPARSTLYGAVMLWNPDEDELKTALEGVSYFGWLADDLLAYAQPAQRFVGVYDPKTGTSTEWLRWGQEEQRR